MSDHTEYMRRNLLHSASVGANANLDVVLFRLSANKNTPAWLKSSLNGVKDRIRPLPRELAKWRDDAPDKPTF